jgi:hypothetical protein
MSTRTHCWQYGQVVYVISCSTGRARVVRKLVMREDEKYGIELSSDSLHPQYWRPHEIYHTRAAAEAARVCLWGE